MISVHEYINISNNLLTIHEVIKLLKIKDLKEINLLTNKELGNFQQIEFFDELKDKVEHLLKIKEEKENLLNIINNRKLNSNIKSSTYKI